MVQEVEVEEAGEAGEDTREEVEEVLRVEDEVGGTGAEVEVASHHLYQRSNLWLVNTPLKQ